MTFLRWCNWVCSKRGPWQGHEIVTFCWTFMSDRNRPHAPTSDKYRQEYLDRIYSWARPRGFDARTVRAAWDAWQKELRKR